MSPSSAQRCLPLLLCFWELGADCSKLAGSHSLRYLFSFLSEPLPGVPQYSVVGFVDDVPIIVFTSDSGRAGPRAPWIEKITDEEPQFWEESTETFQDAKKRLSDSLRDLMEQKKHPPALHVLQAKEGCELRDDGSGGWFEGYVYDGSTLNDNTYPASASQDLRDPEQSFGCYMTLKKLLEYGAESLLRRVKPRTRVSQRNVNDRTFLVGYAYGFYPRDIEVKWVRDGAEIPWESKELLPHPDGTYQVRTEVEVQEGDDVKTYKYHVTHSSLPETVIEEYEEKSPAMGAIIGGVIGALVGVGLLAAVVWVVYKKTSANVTSTAANQGNVTYTAANQAE